MNRVEGLTRIHLLQRQTTARHADGIKICLRQLDNILEDKFIANLIFLPFLFKNFNSV